MGNMHSQKSSPHRNSLRSHFCLDSKTKMKHSVGPFEVDGEAISSVEAMANMLRDQFPSVFSAPKSLGATAHCSIDEFVEIGKACQVERLDDL
jgi:hypothetical protein